MSKNKEGWKRANRVGLLGRISLVSVCISFVSSFVTGFGNIVMEQMKLLSFLVVQRGRFVSNGSQEILFYLCF